MYVTYVVVTAITITATAAIAVDDLRGAKFVVANSAEVGVPTSWIPILAALKAAGAAGLLAGLFGIRFLGILAATGLTLFFTGALIAHLCARVLHNIYYPGAFWLLAIASLARALAT